jgi:hypothetical protein
MCHNLLVIEVDLGSFLDRWVHIKTTNKGNSGRRKFSKISKSPSNPRIDLPRPQQAQMLFPTSIKKLELRTMWDRKIE